MNRQELIKRLRVLSLEAIKESNKANPFISKSEAFSSFNYAWSLK